MSYIFTLVTRLIKIPESCNFIVFAGYYLYIDSAGISQGEVATLDMATIPAGTYCLSFQYHMYGAGIGNLKAVLNGQTGTDKEVFSITGTVTRVFLVTHSMQSTTGKKHPKSVCGCRKISVKIY